jgi:hypothetical protein
VLVAQLRVPRQRTFSASRIRRTWLRPTAMPASPGRLGEGVQGPLRRAALIVRGQFPGSVASQAPGRHRPGRRDDRRPLRLGDPPLAPGARGSPRPSRPTALNRCSQRRTLFGWQPIPAAIAGTVRPSQLAGTGRHYGGPLPKVALGP